MSVNNNYSSDAVRSIIRKVDATNKKNIFDDLHLYYNIIMIDKKDLNQKNLLEIITENIDIIKVDALKLAINYKIYKMIETKNKQLFERLERKFKYALYNDFRDILVYILRGVIYFSNDERFNLKNPIKSYIQHLDNFDKSYDIYKNIFNEYKKSLEWIMNKYSILEKNNYDERVPIIVCFNPKCIAIRYGDCDINDIYYRLGYESKIPIYDIIQAVPQKKISCFSLFSPHGFFNFDISSPNHINDEKFIHSAQLNRFDSYIVKKYKIKIANETFNSVLSPCININVEKPNKLLLEYFINFIKNQYFRNISQKAEYSFMHVKKYRSGILYPKDRKLIPYQGVFMFIPASYGLYSFIHLIPSVTMTATDIKAGEILNTNKKDDYDSYISNIIKSDEVTSIIKTTKYFTLPIW